jgi:uncharacterized protein (DUF1330 family)
MPAFNPTKDQFRALRDDPHDGPIIMINLLKFHEKAVYPEDAPEAAENLTGEAAYARYEAGLNEFVRACGGEVVYNGKAVRFYIGEGDWDRVLIVRYPNREAFVAMVTHPDYQIPHRHRAAGLKHQDLIETREG